MFQISGVPFPKVCPPLARLPLATPSWMFAFTHAPLFLDGIFTASLSRFQALVMKVLGEGAPPEDQVKVVIEKAYPSELGRVGADLFLDAMGNKLLVGDIKYANKQVFRVFDEDPSDRVEGVFDLLGPDEGLCLKTVFEAFDRDNSGCVRIAELKEAFSKLGESLVNLPLASQTHSTIHGIF